MQIKESNDTTPWKEEVLRSLSMSILSMRLSSTARTWNWVSTAMSIKPAWLLEIERNKERVLICSRNSVCEWWGGMEMGLRDNIYNN